MLWFTEENIGDPSAGLRRPNNSTKKTPKQSFSIHYILLFNQEAPLSWDFLTKRNMAKVAAIQTQYILQMPQIQHKMQALQHDIQYTNTRNKETQVAFQEKTTSLFTTFCVMLLNSAIEFFPHLLKPSAHQKPSIWRRIAGKYWSWDITKAQK